MTRLKIGQMIEFAITKPTLLEIAALAWSHYSCAYWCCDEGPYVREALAAAARLMTNRPSHSSRTELVTKSLSASRLLVIYALLARPLWIQ